MLYLYGGLFLFLIVLTFVFRFTDPRSFADLNQKEHAFLLFYPFASKLLMLFRIIFPENRNSKIQGMLKSIFVKENVDREKYLYSVRKIATALAILTAVSVLGCMLCIVRGQITILTSLERNPYGGGSQTYPLEVEYEGTAEEIDLSVDAVKLTEEEILTFFDDSIEGIKSEILGENESLEQVCSPVHFIPDYQGIAIFWEIEDPKILSYNGDISVDIVDKEPLVLNLFATLSLEDVSKTYVIPVILTAKELSRKEQLVQEIREDMETVNSAYEKEVVLPDTVNGEKIVFRKRQEHNEFIFLILGLIGIGAVFVGMDRALEQKVKKRQAQMAIDFTEIVSKLSLLYEAGLSIRKAWERIVEEQEQKGEERFAYQEMKLALEKINSGISEPDAYVQFGKRCGLHSYMKLGNLLEQNLSKGTKGMKQSLKTEVQEAFEERKKLARKKGEEASTKLLVPMVLMLVVVLIIIAVPALMAINL